MLNRPARSPLSDSRRLPGGTLRSWSRSAISIWRSLRRATLAMLANRLTRRPLESASVSAHLNDSITHSAPVVTYRVTIVNRRRTERDRLQTTPSPRADGSRSRSPIRSPRLADVTARPARTRPPPRPRQRDARTHRHRAREQVEQDVNRVEDATGHKRSGCTRRAGPASPWPGRRAGAAPGRGDPGWRARRALRR